jgi:hypothetical protein
VRQLHRLTTAACLPTHASSFPTIDAVPSLCSSVTGHTCHITRSNGWTSAQCDRWSARPPDSARLGR